MSVLNRALRLPASICDRLHGVCGSVVSRRSRKARAGLRRHLGDDARAASVHRFDHRAARPDLCRANPGARIV